MHVLRTPDAPAKRSTGLLNQLDQAAEPGRGRRRLEVELLHQRSSFSTANCAQAARGTIASAGAVGCTGTWATYRGCFAMMHEADYKVRPDASADILLLRSRTWDPASQTAVPTYTL